MKTPNHLKASRAVQKRKMTHSDALMAAALAQRLRKQVIVQGVKFASVVTVIPATDFGKIGIDESYQRQRATTEVNDLITVLKAGGQVASPVDIAQRPDGTWWLVDGQQRFWAHSECELPLKAHIHLVPDHDSEVKLFIALNSKRNLMARTVIKGWPGQFGHFIRRMNESEKSPVRGMIDLKANSKLPLDASAILRGVLAVMYGSYPSGDTTTSLLPKADAALNLPGGVVWAEAFIHLIAAVFGMKSNAGRVRVLPIIALGRVAHRKYKAAGRPVFPGSCARLRAKNWDTAVPSHARMYLSMLEEQIERLWR